MDRPHLVGWGSLHRFRRRSLTSLCHRPGTASPVPEPEGSWLDPHLAACVLRSPVRPRPPPCRTLRDDMSSNRDAFRRVVTDRVAPTVDSADAFWFECAARLRPPFSPRSRRLVCQHVGAECSLASVALPICLAAPRASRRAMRQTDFCLLTFFVPVPAPRRFSMRHALARLRDRGDRLLHISAIRFGGTHVCRGVTAVGVVFPSRCVRSVPLASLSLLSRLSCRSRDVRTHESCRDHPQPDRVNDASWTDGPRCLPSSKNLCPATPSRASGSGLHRGRGLATATPDLDTFSPPRVLADSRKAGPPSTRPVANG